MPSATGTRRHAIDALVVLRDGRVGANAECGRERLGDASLEEIAGRFAHLALDDVERLSFALADLDREQLEEMPVVVRRRGAGSFRPVEQAVRDVKANRARARRCARGRVGWAHAGGVDEGGDMSGEPASVPRRVPRVRAKQGDGRFSHDANIITAASRYESRESNRCT